MIEPDKLKQIIEAALLAADEPLTVDQFLKLFRQEEVDPEEIRGQVREALKALEEDCAERGYELVRVASGFRFQVRQALSPWVSRLWEEKPPRYSRALLETLALVAYKQPVTRGDIEDVRGVSVSQSIMRTLIERGWIRVVGQREVPGRPAMYGTTRAFLDYFNLKSLDQLPPLPEIRELIEPVIVAESQESPDEGAAAAAPQEDAVATQADAEATGLAVGEDAAAEPTADTSAAGDAPAESNASAEADADVDAAAAAEAAAAEAEVSLEPAAEQGPESEEAETPPSAEVVPLPTAQR